MDECIPTRPNYHKVYDAIVIGSGITGGWAAKELAEAGLEILVLEAGPLTTGDKSLDASQWNYSRRLKASQRQPIQSQHPSYWLHNPDLFVDDLDHPYTQPVTKPFIWIRGRQVGGRGLTWGGVTLRLSDYELRAAERDGVGPRWPLKYHELAPYYDKVERFLKVQGSKEQLDQLPDGVFTSPPCLTETEKQFKKVVEATWRERRVIICRGIPLQGILPDLGNEGFLTKASLSTTLAFAVATGRVVLRPDAIVSHLIVEPSKPHLRGVVFLDRSTKETFEVVGRVVVLCASTIESIRIMLNSKSAQFPGGVGNSSGLLGRFLCDHMCVTLAGTIPGRTALKLYPLGGAHSFLIPRFRNLREEGESFIRGYGIWGGMQRAPLEAPSGAARWFMNSLLEVLPRRDNRICIDETKVDSWGIKTVKVDLSYSENELRMKDDAQACMLQMVDAANLNANSRRVLLPGQYVHELGGARMGAEPAESVLNRFNQCWDVKNLFVLDGACFVTSGWQNPSLTMMALAVRACDSITTELKRGSL